MAQAGRVPARNGQALSVPERTAVLQLINTPTYADHSIGQIYARELDDGRYWCSVSSMYRIAGAAGQSRERRRQATHPAKVKPQLLADGPSQVWTWDIKCRRRHLMSYADLRTMPTSALRAQFMRGSKVRKVGIVA